MAASSTKKKPTVGSQPNKNKAMPTLPAPSRVKKWDKAHLKKRIEMWKKYIASNDLPMTLQSFFLFIPRRTINNWKDNINQQDLYEMYKDQVHIVVENYQLNKMMTKTNSTSHIFYLKSAFKYSDKPEQAGDQYMIQLDLSNNGPNKLKENKDGN